MSSNLRCVKLNSPEATTRFAEQLSDVLSGGDVVLLEGPIGSGKSHFSRAIIQSLILEPEDVPSPTFTIVQSYETPGFPIWHCDLYRLTSPDEALELGLDEAFESALCLIEWPDRLGVEQPENALHISFEHFGEEGRKLSFKYSDKKWSKILEFVDE